MRLRHLYLVLCILGILLPYSQFIPWFVEHGLDFPLFFRQLFANRISAFFGMESGQRESNPHGQLGRLELYH
jgi:Protein of unknown function DUF2834